MQRLQPAAQSLWAYISKNGQCNNISVGYLGICGKYYVLVEISYPCQLLFFNKKKAWANYKVERHTE